MLKLLLSLCALSIGLCYATTSCHELQKSQLASLNERITQMLSSLYTSPKTQSAATTAETAPNAAPTDEYASTPYDASYYPYHPAYVMPAPQVVYVSPPHAAPYPFYPQSPKPSVPTPPSPYYHLESAVQPLDPYRAVASVAPKSPVSHYYERYQYPPSVQYPPPPLPPPPYAPTPYPPAQPLSYPYSWEYSTPYPEYPTVPSYIPKPVYSAPAPVPSPSYQPPPAYPPPISYPPAPYYPKQYELQPPPYYV
nr:extensin-2-like [Vanessa tameamea]